MKLLSFAGTNSSCLRLNIVNVNEKAEVLSSIVDLPKSGHVHHDFINPIQAWPVNTELGKYCCTSSWKTAKLALFKRHLLTAVNQLTLSFLCTL